MFSSNKRHSILKNTFVEEEVKLVQVFNPKVNFEIIKEIEKAGEKSQNLQNCISPVFLKNFSMKAKSNKERLEILRGVNLGYLRLLFSDGLEETVLFLILNVVKEFYKG